MQALKRPAKGHKGDNPLNTTQRSDIIVVLKQLCLLRELN